MSNFITQITEYLPSFALGSILGYICNIVVELFKSHFESSLQKKNETSRIIQEDVISKIGEIGSNLYSLISCCDIYLKKCEAHPKALDPADKNYFAMKDAFDRWIRRAGDHRKKLDSLIGEVRYYIWDNDLVIEKSLRLIGKFGSWISTYRYRWEEGRKKLEEVDELRSLIDQIMITVSRTGELPSNEMCEKVKARYDLLKPSEVMDDEKLDIIANVDFLIPVDIVKSYVDKFAKGADGNIDESNRGKMYCEMINALERGVH